MGSSGLASCIFISPLKQFIKDIVNPVIICNLFLQETRPELFLFHTDCVHVIVLHKKKFSLIWQENQLKIFSKRKSCLYNITYSFKIDLRALFSLTLLMGLTAPPFSVLNNEISGRDIILIAGGLFLLGKSTLEIHDKLEGEEGHSSY